MSGSLNPRAPSRVGDAYRPGTLGATALHTAVWTNDVEMIIQLLGAGASPDVKDAESGLTALHRAVYFGHLVAATTLLEYGASLTEEDHAGRVPADLLPSTAAAHQPLAPSEAATEVYAMGDGVNYTLGTGAVGLQLMPHALDTLHTRRITCIATSKFHSAAVALDGTLFTWVRACPDETTAPWEHFAS
jgi:ankyrin repeat protein